MPSNFTNFDKIFDYSDFKKRLKKEGGTRAVLFFLKHSNSEDIIEKEPFFYMLKDFIYDIKYNVPKSLESSFDYYLLLALITFSFSSDYNFIFSENNKTLIPDFEITDTQNNITDKKIIAKLSSAQIISLFEIYLEEIIKWFGASKIDKDVKIEIEKTIKYRASIFKKKRIKLDAEIKRRKLIF